MRPFLRKAGIFALLPLMYFLVSASINYFYISNEQPDVHESTILITGDSHLQNALNPGVFNSASNICQRAEPYILTYWKLKKLLPIINPDTLILGFSHHNISSFNDLKFSDTQWANEMFKRSYLLYDFRNPLAIRIDYEEYFRTLLFEVLLYPSKNHIKYVGHFYSTKRNNISDLDRAVKRHFYYNNEVLPISETSIAYMDSILTLCKSNNITPILVSSPVHSDYYDIIPEVYIIRYEMEKRKCRSKGILVIDQTANFYSDTLYYNADHLNRYGARIFSRDIKHLIEK